MRNRAGPKDPDPAKAAWLEEAGAQKERIIRTAGKEEYFRVLGTLGFDSIAEVPDAGRKKVLDALRDAADNCERQDRTASDLDKDRKDDFMAMARPLMAAIIKAKGSDYFARVLATCKVNNLEDVRPEQYNAVITALQYEADNLKN